MRRLLPLVPAWLVGAWVLSTGDVWSVPAGEARGDDPLASGWMLLAALVGGTVLYLGARVFGQRLAVITSGSSIAGLGAPTDAQAAFGAGLVRVSVLFGLYVVVFAAAVGPG